MYEHPDIDQVVNIQPSRRQMKAYQVRQVLRQIQRYNLELED